jgi:hypothetical protein
VWRFGFLGRCQPIEPPNTLLLMIARAPPVPIHHLYDPEIASSFVNPFEFIRKPRILHHVPGRPTNDARWPGTLVTP